MLISPIFHSGIKTFSPAFKAQNDVSLIKNADPVSDVFIKEKNNYPALQRLYQKFNSSLDNISVSDIEKILKDNPNIPAQNLLCAMYKITEFSNTESIVKLKDKLEKNDIGSVEVFYPMFENRVVKVKSNDTTKYELKIPHSQFVPLGTVLGYLFNESYTGKAKCPLDFGPKKALVLDSHSLDYLKKIKQHDPETFEIYKKKYLPIFIENFENTYNFLEKHNDFSKESVNLARKITAVKEKYPQKDINEIADIILNAPILKEIKNLGIEPLIIKQEYIGTPKEDFIAKRLSSKAPSKEQFENAIRYCLKNSGYEGDEKAEKFLLDYLNNNTYMYSTRTLSQKLIELHKMIEQDVKKHGKPVDKIYYNVINAKKSYGLICYTYQKANNIPKDRFIYLDTLIKTTPEALKKILPKDSTVVMLDDNIISGAAITSRDFNYENDFDKYIHELEDYDLIFSSVLSFDYAKDDLKRMTHRNGREAKDRIISVDNASEPPKSEFDEILNPKKFMPASTVILFPYFAPDNNAPNQYELYKLYYPQSSFVKKSMYKSALKYKKDTVG